MWFVPYFLLLTTICRAQRFSRYRCRRIERRIRYDTAMIQRSEGTKTDRKAIYSVTICFSSWMKAHFIRLLDLEPPNPCVGRGLECKMCATRNRSRGDALFPTEHFQSENGIQFSAASTNLVPFGSLCYRVRSKNVPFPLHCSVFSNRHQSERDKSKLQCAASRKWRKY